jgi:hypothetical protein
MNTSISPLTRSNPHLITLLTACFGLALMANAAPQTWSVTSPNGAVKISVQLADLGGQKDFPAGARLYYRVEHGLEGNRATVIADAPLGLQLRGQDFAHKD